MIRCDEWIQCDDSENSVFVFSRFAENRDDHVTVLMNFTPVPRADYRIGVHSNKDYTELLNSDSELYGGANIGNAGVVKVDPVPKHGKNQSVSVQLPPLSVVFLKSS